MIMIFTNIYAIDELPWKVIQAGEIVTAIAASPKAGCFVAKYHGYMLHIPRRITELNVC